MDPINGPMRLQLETATQGILRDLLEGTPQLSYQLSHSSYRLRHDPNPLHAPSEQISSERRLQCTPQSPCALGAY